VENDLKSKTGPEGSPSNNFKAGSGESPIKKDHIKYKQTGGFFTKGGLELLSTGE